MSLPRRAKGCALFAKRLDITRELVGYRKVEVLAGIYISSLRTASNGWIWWLNGWSAVLLRQVDVQTRKKADGSHVEK